MMAKNPIILRWHFCWLIATILWDMMPPSYYFQSCWIFVDLDDNQFTSIIEIWRLQWLELNDHCLYICFMQRKISVELDGRKLRSVLDGTAMTQKSHVQCCILLQVKVGLSRQSRPRSLNWWCLAYRTRISSTGCVRTLVSTVGVHY